MFLWLANDTDGPKHQQQQMRWARAGANLLLQVRCGFYNGTLGSGFGQKLQTTNDPYPPITIAA
jgi:hypothetical protein